MAHFHNPSILGSSGNQNLQYRISRSLRFNSADSAYLSRTPGSAGNRKTWTLSWWQKLVDFPNSVTGTTQRHIFFTGSASAQSASTYFRVVLYGDNVISINNNTDFDLTTTRVFRDFSAWYHFVLAFDTTQATASNRIKLYINGVQETTFSTATYPAQNTDYGINQTAYPFYIGSEDARRYFNGYLADIYLLDGTATTPSTFAETDAITGQWVPKTPTGISYGTNGFRLTFSDNSGTTSTTLGKDAAGSNNWSPNNFSVASGSGNDSLVDSPTSYGTDTGAGGEVRGNYCTLQPLNKSSNVTLSNGNLDADVGASGTGRCWGTFGVNSGKWYFEYTKTSGTYSQAVGIKSDFAQDNNNNYLYQGYDGTKTNASGSNSAYGAAWGNNDVIGVAFDLDAGTITFYKNGTSQGQAFSGIPSTTWYPYFPQYSGGANAFLVNFGQRAFAYTAPSGFKALCDTNLTAPTIAKPADYFDITLWTGNSTNGRAITGLAFQPEFVWIKRRSASYSNLLFDAVRGFGGTGWTKQLISDSTAAEDTGTTNTISSFDTGGFTLGTDGGVNSSGSTYVGWCWDAASSNSTNTSGTITSTVRANATAGFSIVTYTGNGSSSATIGHGGLANLSNGMIFVKGRSLVSSWYVYHGSIGNTKYARLNNTDAFATSSAAWNNTSPTSTVFSIGSDLNNNGDTWLAYCFAPVAGYSAFGSYTGNGSTDGPFVFTGHRSRWLMVKRTDVANEWTILDTARSTYNEAKAELYPSASAAEGANGGPVDINSNGFKLRTTASNWNTSSGTYVYASFAEFPFAYARAR